MQGRNHRAGEEAAEPQGMNMHVGVQDVEPAFDHGLHRTKYVELFGEARIEKRSIEGLRNGGDQPSRTSTTPGSKDGDIVA